MIVAVDYFTKWVEAKLLASITSRKVLAFVYDQIITRFGMPQTLITDNGTQFVGEPFKSWCENQGILRATTSPNHSQNGIQEEVANKEIVKGVEKRLNEYKTCWVDELSSVLWAHRTTPREITNETPFSLVYGTEAVMPTELLAQNKEVAMVEEDENSPRLDQALA
ncbi:rve domain-containing protein [Artemisia annua]|uniref:Rve domain-containing protein n=1 Tax=Artemisia annua TaxID=35608 RepID=A0A2U1PEK4_ARTAN|nr:rve domain-containing protein [Artemisia annua]